MTSRVDTLPGPWRHRMIHVRGQRLHVAECGRPTDPLVLFIHGSTGGWFEWRRVLPLLNDGSADHRPVHAVAISMRGYGQSDRTPNGYDPMEAAQDVASSIRSLGHSKALLVCQGFGTWVAWTLAATQPNLVAGIIGCGAAHPKVWLNQLKNPWSEDFRNSLAPLLSRSWWNSRPQIPRLRRNKFSSQARQQREQRIINRMVADSMAATGDGFAESAVGQETADFMRENLAAGALRPALAHIAWWTKPAPIAFRKWLNAVEGSRSSDERTVLLVGDADTRTPRTLAELSCPNTQVIPGNGHFLPEENPEAVVRAIEAHLDWLPEYS
jgi:pimeloyl-ACP methyl ester carboxylesterase